MKSTERRDALKDLLNTTQFFEYAETNPDNSDHLHPHSSSLADLMNDDDSIQLNLDGLQLSTPGKVTDQTLIFKGEGPLKLMLTTPK